MLLETVKKLHRESPPESYATGRFARFLRIDDKYGFKLYNSELERDFSYDMQSRAALYGLGPNVLDKIQLGGRFGFITEAVTETLRDRNSNLVSPWNCETCGPPEYNKLIEDLRSNGMNSSDLCGFNVGYMPDGRLVCIDFGDFDDESSSSDSSSSPDCP
jgi:hypothetical protein